MPLDHPGSLVCIESGKRYGGCQVYHPEGFYTGARSPGGMGGGMCVWGGRLRAYYRHCCPKSDRLLSLVLTDLLSRTTSDSCKIVAVVQDSCIASTASRT